MNTPPPRAVSPPCPVSPLPPVSPLLLEVEEVTREPTAPSRQEPRQEPVGQESPAPPPAKRFGADRTNGDGAAAHASRFTLSDGPSTKPKHPEQAVASGFLPRIPPPIDGIQRPISVVSPYYRSHQGPAPRDVAVPAALPAAALPTAALPTAAAEVIEIEDDDDEPPMPPRQVGPPLRVGSVELRSASHNGDCPLMRNIPNRAAQIPLYVFDRDMFRQFAIRYRIEIDDADLIYLLLQIDQRARMMNWQDVQVGIMVEDELPVNRPLSSRQMVFYALVAFLFDKEYAALLIFSINRRSLANITSTLTRFYR